jgi:NCS2 family nucleobase:cation symporter-2
MRVIAKVDKSIPRNDIKLIGMFGTRYITGKKIASADWITFMWSQTFPLSFYAPAVLPLLVASIVAATECIGDVTATTEASGLPPYGTFAI